MDHEVEYYKPLTIKVLDSLLFSIIMINLLLIINKEIRSKQKSPLFLS